MQDDDKAIRREPLNKQSLVHLILHKELTELYLPKSCTISFPNGKDDLTTFVLSIAPDEGYYMGGKFLFTFNVSSMYPYEAPKVMCITQVYHPNIGLDGKVYLKGLRGDWTPVHNIKTIEPSHEDPINHEAASFLRDKPNEFRANVRTAMAGGRVEQTYSPACPISHLAEKLNLLCFM
ncbi:NEDD8-conjugating enzyme Ubc12 [Tanacetum coccineum]